MSRKVKDWIEGYVKCVSNTEPSKNYHLWTAIAAIASVLQRKCQLGWGTLTFYPNMYIVLVGPPAARKGTAMNLMKPMLDELQIKMAAEAITREALIRELKNSNDTLITDGGKMFFHSSLTVWSQELTVFLGYQNHQLMSDLTDWYDCRNQWTYRTKNMGTDEIIGVFVNIFGATTPDLIRSTMSLDAIGGGLTSRMIFIYEENKGKVCPYPAFSAEEKQIYEDLKYDLARIHMLNGQFKTTECFLDRWVEWYTWQEANPPFRDPRFAGYLERRANHVMKLAMICSASRSDKMVVSAKELDRAISVIESAEVKMTKTFSGVGQLSNASVMEKIMVEVGLRKTILFSKLLELFTGDVDKWGLEKILETLTAMKFVKTIALPNDTEIVKLNKE